MTKKQKKIVNEKNVKFLISKNIIFKNIYDTYGRPPEWERKPGFETLVKIILEQQVSLESAKAHFIKLKQNIGSVTPKNIYIATEQQLIDSHLSRQKRIYVKALADEILHKGLNLKKMEDWNEEEITNRLIKIKGIGHWTINIYLMMCLKKTDIFPLGDIALKNTMKKLTGLQSEEEMLSLSNQWRPYRSLATFFMWHQYLSEKGKRLPE
ncbi:MAG: DNA-3-methyladenine glycosylase 2 family protein [Chitinophagaceae bacterium]